MSAAYPPVLDSLDRGEPVRLSAVGGGCIAQAQIAEFADGSSAFVKRKAGLPTMFEREAEGLEALAAAGAIRVPRVLAIAQDALVLEHIHPAPRSSGFFEHFGRAFARLHRHPGPACGFAHDNFIGATPQVNAPLHGAWNADPAAPPGDGADWPGFFIERRLRFQAELAAERGFGKLAQLLDACEPRFEEMLEASIEPPSILHGDLWGGNYIVDERGEACLIDPAAYFGHREADLAMTHLFGGFETQFYRAYEDEWPLAPGHEERLPIYQLYHLLNHLNLFGSGYYAACERILERFAR